MYDGNSCCVDAAGVFKKNLRYDTVKKSNWISWEDPEGFEGARVPPRTQCINLMRHGVTLEMKDSPALEFPLSDLSGLHCRNGTSCEAVIPKRSDLGQRYHNVAIRRSSAGTLKSPIWLSYPGLAFLNRVVAS